MADVEGAEDAELVAAAIAGERTAFEALLRRHYDRVHALAWQLTGSRADADDIAQEAFVHAYEQLATCRQPERFAAWLLTIVHRRALNRLRTIRRRRAVPLESDLAAEQSAGPLQDLERADLRTRLLAALSRLKPIQREIVLLADVEHWSHERIASATGVSVLMSRRHLSDARRRLRVLLSPSTD